MSKRPYGLERVDREPIKTDQEAQQINDDQALQLMTAERLLAAALQNERLIAEYSMSRVTAPGAKLAGAVKTVIGSSTIAETLRISHLLLSEVVTGMDKASVRLLEETLKEALGATNEEKPV